jgi:hypothetical protein
MNSLFHIVPIVLVSLPAFSNPMGNHFDVVNPHSSHTYNFFLGQGEDFNFFVIGNGRTDLDCFVYDEHGNEIEKDTNVSDVCRLSGSSALNGKHILKIVNLGNYSNHYSIVGF